MYVVTREDLSIPQQLVQSTHSAIRFQHEHSEIAKDWDINSQYLACLSTKDEESLKQLIKKAESKDIKYTVFIEPDINNEMTSVTFEPSDLARRLTSSLPKMFKNLNLKKEE